MMMKTLLCIMISSSALQISDSGDRFFRWYLQKNKQHEEKKNTQKLKTIRIVKHMEFFEKNYA